MRNLRQLFQAATADCSSVPAASGGSVVPEMERGRVTPARAIATLTGDGRGSAETAAPAGRGWGGGDSERMVALGFGEGRCDVSAAVRLQGGDA